MIAPWPVRYRNWLKKHKPNEVILCDPADEMSIDGCFGNPVSKFLTEKIGRKVDVDEECVLIHIYGNVNYWDDNEEKEHLCVTGDVPENVSKYLAKLIQKYDGKKIQARTALRLLEEE